MVVNDAQPMRLHCSLPVKTWILESIGFLFFSAITGGIAIPFYLLRFGEKLLSHTEVRGA